MHDEKEPSGCLKGKINSVLKLGCSGGLLVA